MCPSAFPVRDDNAMNFDLTKFDQAVPNTSGGFGYYQNNAGRLTTATGVTSEPVTSRATNHQPDQDVVILPAPGELLLFSGNQLHRSTPNTFGRARFSVDFSIVNVPDVMAGRGASLVDAYCTGTAIRTSSTLATRAGSTRTPWSRSSVLRRPMPCLCSAARPPRPDRPLDDGGPQSLGSAVVQNSLRSDSALALMAHVASSRFAHTRMYWIAKSGPRIGTLKSVLSLSTSASLLWESWCRKL